MLVVVVVVVVIVPSKVEHKTEAKSHLVWEVGAWQTVSDVLVAASGSDQQSKAGILGF